MLFLDRMAAASVTTEADILQELVAPARADLPVDSARGLLRLKFSPAATRTIRRLLRENNRGSISAPDRLLLERYIRVGQMLDLMHAKARLSLRNNQKK